MCRRRVVRVVHVALELGEGGDVFCDARGGCYGNRACRLCAVVRGGRCRRRQKGRWRRRRRRVES